MIFIMRFSFILFLSAVVEVAGQNVTAPKAAPVAAAAAAAAPKAAPKAAPVVAAPKAAPVAAPVAAATVAPEEEEPVINGTAAPTPFVSTLVPTVAPFVVPPLQDCYTDLQDVFTLARVQDPFAKNVYNLCPNTVFQIGHLNASSYCCIGGQMPLWPRKDTTYQCGEDGKSSNNCTFVGGATQVISFAPHWNFEKKSNTAFKGITFVDAQDMSVLIMTDGEFLFEDCIFKNHTNKGAIKLAHYYRRRMEQDIAASNKYLALTDAESNEAYLETYDEETEHNYHRRRYMQEDGEILAPPDDVRQRVTFNNCLFAHNGPGPKTELTHYGVIYAETPYVELVVNNSIFLDNAFEGSGVVGDSFAIHVVKDSTLEIHNTCFLGNNFVGRGAVMVDVAESIVSQSGNYATNDAKLDCQFINVGDKTCVEFTSPTCTADRYYEMMGLPNPKDSAAPEAIAVESTESGETGPEATEAGSTPAASASSAGAVAPQFLQMAVLLCALAFWIL